MISQVGIWWKWWYYEVTAVFWLQCLRWLLPRLALLQRGEMGWFSVFWVLSTPSPWTNPTFSMKFSVHFCMIRLLQGHLCLPKCVKTAVYCSFLRKCSFQQPHVVFKITTRQPQFIHPHSRDLLLCSSLLLVSSMCTEIVRVEMLIAHWFFLTQNRISSKTEIDF